MIQTASEAGLLPLRFRKPFEFFSFNDFITIMRAVVSGTARGETDETYFVRRNFVTLEIFF